MPLSEPQSLRRLLLTHELAFLVLVVVAGIVSGVWAYFWQQTSAESIRLNGLAHVAQEIRADLFRQIKEVTLARLRDDLNAEAVHSTYTKQIKQGFNQLRQRSVSRAEDYAVQALQEAYSTIQVDMNTIFEDHYLLNRMVRSKLLDPAYEQTLVGEFEAAFRNLRGLINQELDRQSQQIQRWTQFAPFVIPIPIVIAIILLLFSRASLMAGFVRPVQSLVAALRGIGDDAPVVAVDPGGVAEVGEIVRGINEMSHELEISRDALIDSERQAALGALVPVVAHNIRNPLASIRATAQLLGPDNENWEINESKDAIIQTVDRLERWVSALVSYLHPLRPQNKLTRATALLEATLSLLESRLVEKSINVIKRPWDSGLQVQVDPDLMEQAFYALFSNALEASPDNTTITLSVVEKDGKVLLSIADVAGGMSFTPEPTGLEPGPTTKMRGTGLGIPVAFKICKAHGWEIGYEIDPNVGTTVVVAAPLALSPSHIEEAAD